jgi:hypothetical protein
MYEEVELVLLIEKIIWLDEPVNLFVFRFALLNTMKIGSEDMFITDMELDGTVMVITSFKPRGETVFQVIWNKVETPTTKETLTVGVMGY